MNPTPTRKHALPRRCIQNLRTPRAPHPGSLRHRPPRGLRWSPEQLPTRALKLRRPIRCHQDPRALRAPHVQRIPARSGNRGRDAPGLRDGRGRGGGGEGGSGEDGGGRERLRGRARRREDRTARAAETLGSQGSAHRAVAMRAAEDGTWGGRGGGVGGRGVGGGGVGVPTIGECEVFGFMEEKKEKKKK